MNDNLTHPLKTAQATTFWLPFAAGQSLQLSDDFTLEFDKDRNLPVFLCGEDQVRYRETEKVSITGHSILMGLLVGYGQRFPGLTCLGEEQEYLEDTIRALAIDLFNKGCDWRVFLLGAAHWLEEYAGRQFGIRALKTCLALSPEDTGTLYDYVTMCFYEANEEDDDAVYLDLIREVVTHCPQIDFEKLPAELHDRTRFYYEKAQQILAKEAGESAKEIESLAY